MLKLETLNEVLAEKLTNPGEILELLVTTLAKGQHPAEEWEAFHQAASRDGMVPEVAFAYESVLSGRRIKLVSPPNQAEAFLHAAQFFADRFGDDELAAGYAEKALSASPTHEAAFALLERILRAKGDTVRLARAYLDAAGGERDRERQVTQLRQAAALLAGVEGVEELAIEVYQRILRVDPADAAALEALTSSFVGAGKHRDAARLLEHALARAEGAQARPLRSQLIGMYCDDLGEPHRAMPHVEVQLAEVPDDPRALAAAEALLDNKVMAPRAVTALANAYADGGRHEEAAVMLARELKTARGPRKLEVQKRLATIKQDALNDPVGALELLGPAVAAEPADDDLRRRFVELSLALSQPLEAAKLLGRALQTAPEPDVRARIGATLGIVFLSAGDARRAQAEFESVVEAGTDDSAVLVSASSLVDLYADGGDPKQLAHVLEVVLRLEAPGPGRVAAARNLARVCDSLGDQVRAIPAWEAVLGSEWEDEALGRLQVLYEKAGYLEQLGDVLERRAERAVDAAEARLLAFRAAELRSTTTRDRAGALEAWRAFRSRFGPTREANARFLPLLEQEKAWAEMDQVLADEVGLAPPEERAALWGRIGQLRASRLDDPSAALVAFRAALAADPAEAASRAALERMLKRDDVALEAAALLEPLYRREERTEQLARLLELRATREPDLDRRLEATEEAVHLAHQLDEREWALTLAGRGLAAVVEPAPERVSTWLARVLGLAAEAANPTLRAQVLSDALGDGEIGNAQVLALARATAEALAATDDVERAVAVYRRALRFDPASSELLQKVDELLALQGSPEERLSLYRHALEQPCDAPRRRELLHAMARVQRRDLGDVAAAVATWREAIAIDPRDHAAHQGLVEVFTEQSRLDDLYAEFSRVVEYVPQERRFSLQAKMAEVELARGNRPGALAHYETLVSGGCLDDAQLAAVEALAVEERAVPLLGDVLVRRVELATEPEAKAALLERLGAVLAEQADDAAGAAARWMEAAGMFEGPAADPERAVRLYEAVLQAVPHHHEAADHLVEHYAARGEWTRVRSAFDVLVANAKDGANLVARLGTLEARALSAGARKEFVSLIDSALAFPGLEPARVDELWLAKARVLASEPGQEDEVATIHRRVIEAGRDAASAAADSFGRLLSAAPATPARLADRRWLFEWRASHAADPSAVWLAWAAVEEQQVGDPVAAIALYRRVLERDPTRADALTEVARLQAATGDAVAAVETLRALRAVADPDLAPGVDARISALLLDPLGRAEEALDVARSVLATAPAEVGALDVVRRLLGDAQLAEAAAAVLERVVETEGDATARATVLESLLALESSGEGLTGARKRWFELLLACREEDAAAALEVALRGAREIPAATEMWDAAERLARKLDAPAPVADAYAKVLDGEIAPDLAEEIGRRMVEFHEEWFEEPDRVVGLLKRVHELAPAADWAFDRLKLAFNAAARWDELFALYDRALSRSVSDADRVLLLREAAMAAKDFAADAPRAIGYLEQLNWLVPNDTVVEGTLERLYEREGMSRALIELLTRRLPRVADAELHELRRRLAELWISVGEAIPAFEIVSAMRVEPYAGAETYALLEQVLETATARSSAAPGVKPRRGRHTSVREAGAGFLRDYYESEGRLVDMARMMEIGLEFARSDRDRIARLTEIVELRLGRLEDLAGAFHNVCSLVTLEPALGDHRRLLADLADRLHIAGDRAALLAAVAREQKEVALRAELLQEAASVHVDVLGDTAAAIDLYQEVLELAEDDVALALAAARALDPLLGAAGRPELHCDVLERRAALEQDADARRAALGTAARIAADVLGDLDRAVRDFRVRLRDDPEDLEALDGIVEVLERAGHYEELIDALGTRARAAADPAAARADRVRIARLYGETLGARPPAIAAWHEVRKHSGPDRESFDALVPLLEAEAEWAELAELVEAEAFEADDPDRQRALFRQLGTIHRDRTQQPSAAITAFVAADEWDESVATAADPALGDEEALAVGRDLLEHAVRTWESAPETATGAARAAAWAVDSLADRLRTRGRYEEVAELLERAAGLPFPPARARELRCAAAAVHHDQLADGDAALAILRAVFAEDAGDAVATGSVERLTGLLAERGRHGEIAEIWEAQARARAGAGERPLAAELWTRAGSIWETQAGDVERAIVDFRAGAGLGGEGALEALARIHEARAEHRAAAEALEWLCAQSAPARFAERTLRLADAYVACEERAQARSRLERAVRALPDAVAVRQRLAELYREDQDWARLAALLAVEAERASDAKTRLALLLEAAALHLDQRDCADDAVPLLERAVELDPDDPELRLSLSRALERGGRFEEASRILQQQIERFGARRPKSRALVHFQLARVSLAAGERAQAIAELGVANKIDPAHPGILEALARIAFEEGQLERAEKTYRALLLVIKPAEDADAPSRAEALLDLAAIAERRGDSLQATEFVESAFETALEQPGEAKRLENALRRQGRMDLLARLMEGRLERAAGPAAAARALADLVALQAESAGPEGLPDRESFRMRAQAIQSALERSGNTLEEPWTALSRVYDCLGDANAEVRVLERRVATWRSGKQRPTDAGPFYRLAEIRLADEAAEADALDLLERALEIRPDPRRAITLLAAVVQLRPAATAAASMLERLARASSDDAALALALTAQLADPESSTALLREAVAAAQRARDAGLEERALERGLELALSDEDGAWVRRALAARAAAVGDAEREVELRIEAAELVGGNAARAELLAAAATLRDGLAAPRRAADVFRRLLDADPADRAAWEPLLQILRQLGDRDELLELIANTVPLLDTPADRARLRLEQAELELSRGDDAAAAITLESVLEDDPGEARAAQLLSGVLERTGRSDELVGLLERQLDTAKDRGDEPAIVALALRIGGMREELQHVDAAFDAYRAALDWDPKNRVALGAVARLAEVRGDLFAQGEALEALLGVVRGTESRAIAERLIVTRREEGDPEALDRAYALAFEAFPTHEPFREGWISRLEERGDHLAVADVLLRVMEQQRPDAALIGRLVKAYRDSGQPERALAALEGVVEGDPARPSLLPQRAALLGELGRVEEALQDVERAHALGLVPEGELVSALERVRRVAPADRAQEIGLRLVALIEARGDLQEARRQLAELVESDPTNSVALRHLADLEIRAESWDGAASALGRWLALETGDELVAVALQLFDVCQNAGRVGDALAGLERALEVAPDHAELRARFREVLEVSGDHRRLALLLEDEAGRAADPSETLAWLLRAGSVLLEPDGDVVEAIRVLERARELGPDNVDGTVLLSRALGAAGRGEEALALLHATLEMHRGKRLRALSAVHVELSRFHLEDGMLTDAMDALQKAFEVDPRNANIAMQLGQLGLEMEEYETAAKAFRAATAMRPFDPTTGEGVTPATKADAQYCLAWLAFNEGDARKAKVLATKALAENPEHELAKALLAEVSG